MSVETDFDPSTLPGFRARGLTTEGASERLRGTKPPNRHWPQRPGATTSRLEDANRGVRERTDGSSPGLTVGQAQSTGKQRRAITGVRLSGLQIWTGYITEIEGHTAIVRLNDDDDESPDLVGEFDVSLLGEDDVEPGDVVYVTSRTVLGQTGYPTHTTSLRLRRAGRWTREEVEQIERLARAAEEDMQGLID